LLSGHIDEAAKDPGAEPSTDETVRAALTHILDYPDVQERLAALGQAAEDWRRILAEAGPAGP